MADQIFSCKYSIYYNLSSYLLYPNMFKLLAIIFAIIKYVLQLLRFYFLLAFV